MKSRDYWRHRFELLEERQLNKGVDFYHELEKQYLQASVNVEKELRAWYSRFATENGITLSEAKKLLAGRDLEAFRMDVKEYIKKGRSLDPQWMKQLEQASVRVHVSRLEALKLHMQQQAEALHGYEVDALDKVARDIYTDGYYRTAFEIAKGSGVSATFAALDTAKIDKVISKPWASDGANFSARVWKSRDKLVDELHTLLTQNIIRGEAPDKVIKALSKRFDVSKSAAGRLVMTESAYFSSVAQHDSFKDVGVEEFEFVATLDSHTSEMCFVGSTNVLPIGNLEKVFRASYTGEIITITTSSGQKIVGTPNHPILTSCGWLPLYKINPSEHVVYSVFGDVKNIFGKQNINMPTKFSKLFNSVSKVSAFGIRNASPTATDFHGDGKFLNGKINIADTDGVLRDGFISRFFKKIKNKFFTFVHGTCFLPSDRVDFSLVGGVKVIETSELEIVSFDNVVKHGFRDTQSFNDVSWTNSVIKKLNSFSFINKLIFVTLSSFKMWCNSEFFKKSRHCRNANRIFFCKTRSGNTFPVFEENVVSKSIEFRSNIHVYNLQSSDNVYLANSIITHNCQELDGKIFKMSDWTIGVNVPPLHQWCRSTTVPYFDDLGGERASRDEEGKYKTVPADMTYKEWKNQFVENPVDNSLKGVIDVIRGNVIDLRGSIANTNSKIDNKNQKIKTTEDKIRDLQLEERNLKADLEKYDSIKDRDLDISKYEDEYNKLKTELEGLDAQSKRYYDRPEKGTPERDAWRKWRKTVDMDEIFNKQVYNRQRMGELEKQIRLTKENKVFRDTFNVDSANTRLGAVENSIKTNKDTIGTLKDEIKTLEADKLTTQLKLNDEIKKAGKEFVAEVKGMNLKYADELERLTKENKRLVDKYYSKDTSNKLGVYDEWKAVNEQLNDVKEQAIKNNAQAIKAKLSEVRQVGIGDKDFLTKVHLKNSKSQVVNSVVDAYDLYPREWIDTSIKAGSLNVRKAKRGFYRHSESLITISGNTEAQMFETAIHELGHRFEHTMSDILNAEKTYYGIRTKGESLQWLGKGYSRNETSRFDKFLDKYMGKDYGGTAYELVSMGFEWGYTNPSKLLKDEDMAEWIYGILTLL